MRAMRQASRDVRSVHQTVGALAIVAIFALPVLAQVPGGIPGVIAPGAQAELVQENFVFTEGPVGAADGSLYFSDIRVSKTFHLDAAGKIAMFRENTNG